MKKRVAIIVHGGVGAGNFSQGVPALMNLINGLANSFDITVFSMGLVDEGFSPDNFKIKSLSKGTINWSLIRITRLIRMVLAEHKQSPFDLFHGIWGLPSGVIAAFLGKWLEKSTIISLQGGEAASIKQIRYGVLESAFKKRWLFRALHAADSVTALSHFQVSELKKHGFSGKEISVLPYGVDLGLFSSSAKDIIEPVLFIHIANLTEVKDQYTLLKAFQIIQNKINCQLTIIGEDFTNGKVQHLCEQLSLQDNVSFIGPVPNNQLPAYLSKSHVMLHTSLYEAQAVVVVEAMACNVLVAGTRVGIMDDLLDYVVAVPVGDYERLANHVLQILNEPELMTEKKEKAYQWAKAHDIRYTIVGFSAIYNQLAP